jgi:hypothetical protein
VDPVVCPSPKAKEERREATPTDPSPITPIQCGEAEPSADKTPQPAPEKVSPHLDSDRDTASASSARRSASVTFSLTQPYLGKQGASEQDQPVVERDQSPEKASKPSSAAAASTNTKQQGTSQKALVVDSNNNLKKGGSYQIETRNYLQQQGVRLKPNNPFGDKVVTVYATSPLADIGRKNQSSISYITDSHQTSSKTVVIRNAETGKPTATRNAYVVLDWKYLKKSKHSKTGAESVYLKVDSGCQKYRIPVKSSQGGSSGLISLSKSVPYGGLYTGTSSSVPQRLSRSANPAITSQVRNSLQTKTTPSNTDMDTYNPVNQATLSRVQERQELQHLNDRYGYG